MIYPKFLSFSLRKRQCLLGFLTLSIIGGHLPVMASVSLLSILLISFFLFRMRWAIWLARVLSILSPLYIFMEYRTLFGLEAGFSFLSLLYGLKLLESRKKSDYLFANLINIIVLALFPLHGQTLFKTGISLVLILFLLWNFNLINSSYLKSQFSLSFLHQNFSKYSALTLPMIILLFFFFPRLNLGFNTLPRPQSKSGFSDEAKPSEVSSLALSNTIVFRANFLNQSPPPLKNLYWVGTVLERTDGFNWKKGFRKSFDKVKLSESLLQNSTRYQVSLNRVVNDYLFTLDYPLEISDIGHDFFQFNSKTYKLSKFQTQKLSYQVRSQLGGVTQLEKGQKKLELALPDFPQKRVIQRLSDKLKGRNEKESLQNILNYFKKENFQYSLNPGQSKNLSEFLFQRKKGFCTHFASAFSILARMMGLPGRVIVGFQGGDFNQFGDYLNIREKDAHAWSEVYLEGEGWVRYDPVEIISPSRIEMGAETFFSQMSQETSFLEKEFWKSDLGDFLQSTWRFIDYLNTRWALLMVGFDRDFQNKIADFFQTSLQRLYQVLILGLILCLGVLFYLFKGVFFKVKPGHPLDQIFVKFLKKLQQQGHTCRQTHTPYEVIKILTQESYKKLQEAQEFIDLYVELRYLKSQREAKKDLQALLKYF